jgi:hypothetical protein
MAMAMMLLPPLMAMMSMAMTAAFQGRQLDNGNWTMAIVPRQGDNNDVRQR